jgi:D-threo-aldose 1-dehydrogenase
LLAGRCTPLEQDALDRVLPLCERQAVSVILGGGSNSGILAAGAVPDAKYVYAAVSKSILERARPIERVCHQINIPLKAVAMRLAIRDACSMAQLEANIQAFELEFGMASGKNAAA